MGQHPGGQAIGDRAAQAEVARTSCSLCESGAKTREVTEQPPMLEGVRPQGGITHGAHLNLLVREMTAGEMHQHS